MNGKELLEALTHVDEKYVQEADTQRPVRISFPVRAIAAAAACVCLLVAGMRLFPAFQSANDSSAENVSQIEKECDGAEGQQVPESAAGEDPQSYIYGCRYIRTNLYMYVDNMKTAPVVIRSAEELEAYLDRYSSIYQLEALREACAGYDEAFFQNRDLLLVVQGENSGSVRHEIQSLRPMFDGTWQLRGRKIVPEIGTSDMAQWHILVEIQKNLIAQGETVTVEWYF